MELRIVDDDGVVLPWDGEAVGEIQVRGPWITGSYYRDPAIRRSSTTAGCAPATSPASRRNGYIQITDRAKDVIKSGGEWISSVELEGLLMAHPDVVEAAVIAVPDPRWDERPLACVVCKADADVTAHELREFLGRARRPVAAPRALDVHRRGAEDERRQVRQEGAPRAATPTASSSSRSSREPRAALAAMTAPLAASVFDRLGDDLWLLVPAFVFSVARRRRSSGGCSASDAPFAASVLSGIVGFGLGVLISLLDRERTRRTRRTASPATCSSSRCSARWRRRSGSSSSPGRASCCARRPGSQSVPHPLRSLRRRGRRDAALRRDHPHRGAQRARPLARPRAQGRGVRDRRPEPDGPPPPARARGVRRDVREARPDPVDPHDLLSPDAAKELSLLQDHVAPAGRADVAELLEAELDAPLDDVFADFDWQPLAAASIGQVYRAQLPDGSPVVVKVHPPRASTSPSRVDLSVLEELGRVVETRTSWGADYHVMDLVARVQRHGCGRSSTSASRRATRAPSPRPCPPTVAHLACPRCTRTSARRACS